ncbi:MAG: ABC transporter ATP-binding protein [Mariprofundales bacterium]|nr:ABC transporter ATP-binding protein [Mariprofundales bacterium]
MMVPLLEISNLSFSVPTGHILQRKKQILDKVSFTIPRGSATAYLGKNGAGKTSTFRILCGMVRADSGTIRFEGLPCDGGIPPQRIGFMPEQPYFYRNLTPREMLTSFGRISGMAAADLRQAIIKWSEMLHIAKVLDQPLSACSKGQIQRIGLTQALMHQPDFILLDEPMSGLDPMGRECVNAVLHHEMQRGVTLLFSSHILSDAENLCNQVIILDGGRTIYSGDLAQLTQSGDAWEVTCRAPDHLWQDAPSTLTTSRQIDGSWRITCSTSQERNHLLQQLISNTSAELLSVLPQKRTLEQAFIEILDRGEQP